MKPPKLFLISAVTFLIFSCFIFQTSVFSENDPMDEQAGVTIYIPETDEEIVMDDQMDAEDENAAYYEDIEEPESDEDIYIEDDRFPEFDEDPDYEEESEE